MPSNNDTQKPQIFVGYHRPHSSDGPDCRQELFPFVRQLWPNNNRPNLSRQLKMIGVINSFHTHSVTIGRSPGGASGVLWGATGRHEASMSPNREVSGISGVWAESCKNAGEAATPHLGYAVYWGQKEANQSQLG